MSVHPFLPAQEAALDLEIANSLEELRRAESAVSALVEAGAFSRATLFAQAAAHRAWVAHPGVFVSPAIERALAEAATHIQTDDRSVAPPSRGDNPRRILHVLTMMTYPEGGHGRLLERWIRSDSSREHSVALTSPRHDLPPLVRDAVAAARGRTHRLAPGSSSFVERARHLRLLAADADAIVLHTHPYDALPVLALAWPHRPPTILCNHAPQVFWLGRSIADVVTCGREIGAEVCVRRRAIPSSACFHLPIPVNVPREPPAQSRADTRQALGVAPDDVLLLTIASGYKFSTAGVHDLAATITRVVNDRGDLAWRIAGPEPLGRWAELEERTAGKVRALGIRGDLAALYAAADAFVDSYPFSGRSAMLDAAAARVPLLAPRWHPPETAILGPWGSPVDAAITPFHDEASLAKCVDELRHETRRRELGAAASAAVADTLAGPKWGSRLGQVYALAAHRTALRDAAGIPPHEPDTAVEPDDLDRHLHSLYSSVRPAAEPMRVLINWHREETNAGAASTFPGDEAWLADSEGLAAVIGEQDLIIRDLETDTAQLRGAVAASEVELKTMRTTVAAVEARVADLDVELKTLRMTEAAAVARTADLEAELVTMRNSTSWRATALLRRLGQLIRRAANR